MTFLIWFPCLQASENSNSNSNFLLPLCSDDCEHSHMRTVSELQIVHCAIQPLKLNVHANKKP